MERKALTNSLVASLPKKAKPYDLRDATVKGFLIRVYPSGKKTYRCEYKRGKSMTLGSAEVLTATQARNHAKQILGDVAKGIDPKELAEQKKAQALSVAKQLTLREFIEKEYSPWYETAYPKTWVEMIKGIERDFYADFGDRRLSKITRVAVERWRIQRAKSTRVRVRHGELAEEPVKPATINRNIQKLNAVLNKAVKFGFLEHNPVNQIEKLKVEQKNRVRYLSEVELGRLMQALDEREEKLCTARERGNAWRIERHREPMPDLRALKFVDYLKPMVLLSLGSGIRFGSLIRLQWQRHVDFLSKNTVLKLSADIVKTAKAYEVPLDQLTSDILCQWFKQTEAQHQGRGWVFPGKDPSKHITSVKRSWRSVLKSAEIEDFRWHDQRHDFASQHVMSGTDLYTVMELLGHTDPNMTKRYAHLSHEHKVTAAEKLAERRGKMLADNSELV